MSARSTGGQAPDAPGTEASGVVLVDKPQGWTSHDVVGRVRRLAGTRKVGHAGTLDPMATGLLVVGVNKATRLLTAITGTDKTYTATIRLGQSTVTDDAEGEVVQTRLANAVTPERVAEQVAALTGEILQVPPAVSAVRVEGARAYDLARAGETVELAPRPLWVEDLSLTAAHADGADLHMVCGKGGYVRAIAREHGLSCWALPSGELLVPHSAGGSTFIFIDQLEEPVLHLHTSPRGGVDLRLWTGE